MSDIVLCLYILWVDIFIPVAIKARALLGILKDLAKVFQLYFFKPFSRQGLKIWIPIHHFPINLLAYYQRFG